MNTAPGSPGLAYGLTMIADVFSAGNILPLVDGVNLPLDCVDGMGPLLEDSARPFEDEASSLDGVAGCRGVPGVPADDALGVPLTDDFFDILPFLRIPEEKLVADSLVSVWAVCVCVCACVRCVCVCVRVLCVCVLECVCVYNSKLIFYSSLLFIGEGDGVFPSSNFNFLIVSVASA